MSTHPVQTPPGKMRVDTGKVAGRRPLRFTSLDQMLEEADRLAAAEREGRLRTVGNWTLGQALGHIGAWMAYPFDGYPPEVNPPWFVRVFMKFRKKHFRSGAMPAGVRIPKMKDGTLATEPLPTDEAMSRLRRAAGMLAAAPPDVPNPLFGPLTHDEWIQGNLRHAELHLGFFLPENGNG